METMQNETEMWRRNCQPDKAPAVVEPSQANLSQELLSVLLHDLRSPLGAIGVLTDVIAHAPEEGQAPNPTHISLLQDAVVKAQRILDDAVEIQALLRGSSTISPSSIELQTLIRSCMEKAAYAPYFRSLSTNYDAAGGQTVVRVDVEKAETTILCLLESLASQAGAGGQVEVRHELQPPFAILKIALVNTGRGGRSAINPDGLRGRLGKRRLGESRYSLAVCAAVLRQMGGVLKYDDVHETPQYHVCFPLA